MNRYLPIIVFVVTSAIGLAMTSVVFRTAEIANATRFDRVADEAADRVSSLMQQHLSLLRATEALFNANGRPVNPTSFKRYVASLDLENEYDGIQGIGYARMSATGDTTPIDAQISVSAGSQRQAWPETDQTFRATVAMLEPEDDRNKAAIGFDMMSEPRRRKAMLDAIATGRPQASAPVELVQEITENKQSGFLIYVPFKSTSTAPSNRALTDFPVDGFVYAPFRAGDLHDAALGKTPALSVAVQTYDTTGNERLPLFSSKNVDRIDTINPYSTERKIDIAGREWTMTISSTTSFRDKSNDIFTLVLGIVTLFLAAALAVSTRSQIKAVATARQLHAVSEKTLQDKDLMLQEMRHRIKNSITRMLAMARQTARTSSSLEAFTESYSARLQAMATAQDMLTRSKWERADLRELLAKELEQVFGEQMAPETASGPAIEINERATQALGLTFHELATNALKYGGAGLPDGKVEVRWLIAGKGKKHRHLQIDWIETTKEAPNDPHGKTGFGTRLIDANIRGELSGTVERVHDGGQMTVTIIIPLASLR